ALFSRRHLSGRDGQTVPRPGKIRTRQIALDWRGGSRVDRGPDRGARWSCSVTRPRPSLAALETARANLSRLLEARERAIDTGSPAPHPKLIEAAEKAVAEAEKKASRKRRAAA